MLTLHTAPGSCSRASHIALEEAGLDYQARYVDFARGDQRQPGFLAINPKGRVPALVTDRGLLTAGPAILAYVAALAPEARLAPTDPFDFARMQAFNLYLATSIHVAHAHGRRAARWSDDPAAQASMAAKVSENMSAGFDLIEAGLDGEWVIGDAYSVADPYLFVFSGWLAGDGVDIAQFPKVADHFQRMARRPAVQRVLAWEAARAD